MRSPTLAGQGRSGTIPVVERVRHVDRYPVLGLQLINFLRVNQELVDDVVIASEYAEGISSRLAFLERGYVG